MMHIIKVSQARSFTESSPSEFFSESETELSQLLSASQVADGADEYKKEKMKTCAKLKEAIERIEDKIQSFSWQTPS